MSKKNKINKVLSVIEWLVWAILLTVFFVAISPVLPIKGIPKMYVVVTGSMEPDIKTGSVAIAREIDPLLVKKGDVIVFTSPNDAKQNILHRVEAIKSTNPLMFLTKGDNNNSVDAWDVYAEGVKGVMIGKIPYLGYAAAFVRKPLGFVLLIVIPALLFIFSQILSIKKTINEEIERGVQKKLKENIKKTMGVMILCFSILSLATTRVAKAIFTDKIEVKGMFMSVIDFAPPPTPPLILPENGSVFEGKEISLVFGQVVDVGSTETLRYYVEICDEEYTNEECAGEIISDELSDDDSIEGRISKDGSMLVDGDYRWRVRARDLEGNFSDWSDIGYFTVLNYVPFESRIVNPKTENVTNSYSKRLDYEVFGEGVFDKIVLCQSFNLGNFVCDRENTVDKVLGSFDINFEKGEGVYQFYTKAMSGEAEVEAVDEIQKRQNPYTVQFDKTAPTSGISLNNIANKLIFNGQNLIVDGSFYYNEEEATALPIVDFDNIEKEIWYADGEGSHRLTQSGYGLNGEAINPIDGEAMVEIGFRDKLSNTVDGLKDTIFQIIDIPERLSTTLSFWYRGFSQDTVENDGLKVWIESISGEGNTGRMEVLGTGSNEFNGSSWIEDSDWRWFSKNISGFAGKTVKLIFEVLDGDPEGILQNSWFYIDDIKASTVDLRIGENTEVEIEEHDTGAGIGETTREDNQNSENDLETNYDIEDIAGNQEAPQRSDRVTAPGVVLNKITINFPSGDEFVELYRNDPSIKSLEGWYLVNYLGETYPILSGFNEENKVGFYFSMEEVNFPIGGLIFNDEDTTATMKLINAQGEVVDSTTYGSRNSLKQIWQRLPDGVGAWGMQNVTGYSYNDEPPVVETSVRVAAHKLLLTISSINPNLEYLNYRITYNGNGQEQGFGGEIRPESIPDSRRIDREFYLGTCSEGGKCTDDYVPLGSVIETKIVFKLPIPDEENVYKTIIFE